MGYLDIERLKGITVANPDETVKLCDVIFYQIGKMESIEEIIGAKQTFDLFRGLLSKTTESATAAFRAIENALTNRAEKILVTRNDFSLSCSERHKLLKPVFKDLREVSEIREK